MYRYIQNVKPFFLGTNGIKCHAKLIKWPTLHEQSELCDSKKDNLATATMHVQWNKKKICLEKRIRLHFPVEITRESAEISMSPFSIERWNKRFVYGWKWHRLQFSGHDPRCHPSVLCRQCTFTAFFFFYNDEMWKMPKLNIFPGMICHCVHSCLLIVPNVTETSVIFPPCAEFIYPEPLAWFSHAQHFNPHVWVTFTAPSSFWEEGRTCREQY